ncbi:MAG: hypothetical protein ACKVVT_07540 [Dehalococcoidia bacterium]
MYEPFLAQALMSDRHREAAAIHRAEGVAKRGQRKRRNSGIQVLGGADARAVRELRNLPY